MSPDVHLSSISLMTMEFVRLLVGLALVYFHRGIADYLMEQERSLVVLARQRGLMLPATPNRETAHNIYFGVGVFVVLFELARIYLALHGLIALQ